MNSGKSKGAGHINFFKAMKVQRLISLFPVLLGLSILCGLGTWQLFRLQEKELLLTRLKAEYMKDPAAYPLRYESFSGNAITLPLRGRLEGRFLYAHEIKIGPRLYQEKPGFEVYTPLLLKNGGHVLVKRGWIDRDLALEDTHIEEQFQVDGLAKPVQKPFDFLPQNMPAQDVWIFPDPQAIALHKGLPDMASVVFYAESLTPPQEDFILSKTEDYPHNRHLSYAVFWFTLAGCLAVIALLRAKK